MFFRYIVIKRDEPNIASVIHAEIEDPYRRR